MGWIREWEEGGKSDIMVGGVPITQDSKEAWFLRLGTLNARKTGRRVQTKEVLGRGLYILQSLPLWLRVPACTGSWSG